MNTIALSGTVVRRRVTPDKTTVYRVLIPRQPGMLPNPDGKNFDAIDVCFPQAVGRGAHRCLEGAGSDRNHWTGAVRDCASSTMR